MSVNLAPVIQEVDFLLDEATQLREVGPCFSILHRYWVPGTICHPGEEVSLVVLDHSGSGTSLRLSLAERLLFDYLAHYRLPQSAAQIEAGMRSNGFYVKHAQNVRTSCKQTRKFSRSEIRVYIRRIRDALRRALVEAQIHLDPAAILIGERTSGNEVVYRLRGSIELVHSRH
jgi:hypothetical protein